MIPINRPMLGDEELRAVEEVIKSGRLTEWRPAGGPLTREFERAFASYIGVKHAIAVNSGTAALHAALMAAGIGEGDEVIVPSLTFVATANAVLLVGARPVIVDVDLETYNVKVDEVKRALTDRTKAIIPVHLYGLTADMDPIMEVAEEEGLIVIEDAAQAHGAEYMGRKAGSLGHMACFSFYSTKVITTGEGGMITTNDDELAEKLRSIRTHGQREGYDTYMLGHNYRMTELQAAIGIAQLKKISYFLEARRRNARILSETLSEVEGVSLPIEPRGYRHCWYLYTVRVREELRDMLVERLNAKGIGAAVYYRIPVHRTPLHEKVARRVGDLRNAEVASRTVLQLPVHPGVSEDQAAYIGRVFIKLLREEAGGEGTCQRTD
ncbi:MAG: aminotransferase DegT [Thermoprotei archaeon]|nr:MAG: aminotransferase DegT [Thermoprotei archaeon]